MVRKFFCVCAGMLMLALSYHFGAGTAMAVTLHQSGYSAHPLVSLPTSTYSPSDVEVDGQGNLYVPTLTLGVQRISPGGAVSLWSTVPAVDLTLTSAGDGYGAGPSCRCILRVESNGSYSTLHQDAFEWRYIELGPDGTLYSLLWAGAGQGVYRIDRTSGVPTPIVTGGPGPGGAGWYGGMAHGIDGKLYVNGYDGSGYGLYRLDGSTFTRAATLPYTFFGLTRDETGLFYAATSYFDAGEVWTIDAVSGTAALLASGLALPAGIGYDPLSHSINVAEQYGSRQVWVITKESPTRALAATWGQLKARYAPNRGTAK